MVTVDTPVHRGVGRWWGSITGGKRSLVPRNSEIALDVYQHFQLGPILLPGNGFLRLLAPSSGLLASFSESSFLFHNKWLMLAAEWFLIPFPLQEGWECGLFPLRLSVSRMTTLSVWPVKSPMTFHSQVESSLWCPRSCSWNTRKYIVVANMAEGMERWATGRGKKNLGGVTWSIHLLIYLHFPSPFLGIGPLERSFWWESLFSSDQTPELTIWKQKNNKIEKGLLSHVAIL